MYLQIYKNRGKEYVRIVESYRDSKTKKPKVRVIESFGSKEKLLSKNPNALKELQAKVDQMNLEKSEVNASILSQRVQEFMHIGSSPSSNEAAFVKNYGFEIYRMLWDELKLDYFFQYRQNRDTNIQFQTKIPISLMTFSRLLYPTSKLSTFEGKERFAHDFPCELEHMYRSLSFLAAQKDYLEKHLHKQIIKKYNRNLAVAFYDVTTYYFESVKTDELKNFGFSKDNKVNQVQVVMGLLIDDHGIPVSYELFPGNTNDFKTLEPVLIKLKEQYGIQKLIIVADRGLNSKNNLLFLKSLGFEYIMAYKIRSGSKKAKEMVLDESGYNIVSPGFKWKKCNLQSTVRSEGKTYQINDHLLITWSLKRELKDRKDRERIIQKSKRLVESKSQLKAEMKKGGKKYVQLNLFEDDHISFNKKQLEIDEQFDGYYGIQYSDSTLSPEEVLNAYHGLWKIEDSFRVLKSNFEARPIYVWTEDSIKGHFVICYLALVLQRLLEYLLHQKNLDFSTEKIQDAIRSATITQVQFEGREIFIKNKCDDAFSEILKALKIKDIPTYGEKNKKTNAYLQTKK
ncbi:IS1634 family transposase [Calidifontibacillus erzurumensis]|uniref:IS1634 family transposase n=1 Tax=Calidifontibacillus erzurumensis TaxID=2741433 RepID=UPI0035B54094